MNKKWINSSLNYEVYFSFEGVSSDHQIVTTKIRLILHRNAVQTTTTARYNWSLLNNRDISDKYMITLRNKFNVLQDISETLTPNDECVNFINAHFAIIIYFLSFNITRGNIILQHPLPFMFKW